MDELLVGTKVVAHFFGVSVRAIQQWANAGMPKIKHGIYDLKLCHEWWLSNIADVTVKGSDDSMNAIKIEYWKAKGEAERIRVDLLSKTLIQTSEVEKEIARFLIPIFAAVDQLPNRLPPIVAGKTVQAIRKIINDEVCEIREGLTKPAKLWPAIPIKQGGICKTKNSKTRKRGRPRKSTSSISTTMSMTDAPTEHGDAPIRSNPKSRKNSKKSTLKSKQSTEKLRN